MTPTNSTLVFLESDAAANQALADAKQHEPKALRDLINELEKDIEERDLVLAIGTVGAAIAAISVLLQAASVGSGLATAITLAHSSALHQSLLELTIKNESKYTLIPLTASATDASIAQFPSPILPGTTGSIVISRDDWFTGHTRLQFSLIVGSLSENSETELNKLQTDWIFGYDESKNFWIISAKAQEDSTYHTYNTGTGICGLLSQSQEPKFSCYFSSIPPKDGRISLVFYEYTPLQSATNIS